MPRKYPSTYTNSVDLSSRIDELRLFPYKKGEYASRNWGHVFHSMISYPSKLKPSLAHFLIKLFTAKGQRVLDPFCGVGTIPFEACCQGRIGVGSDLSPIAFHATNAKLKPIRRSEIENELISLKSYIENNRTKTNLEVEKEIESYYHPETLREILLAKKFFTMADEKKFSFLLTCMLHILHGNRPYALSRRSHNIIPWPPKGPYIYKSLIKSLQEKANRMLNMQVPSDFVKGEVFKSSIFTLPIQKESIDCIITSPPFYNNRDFLRMNRIRLWFCGWDYNIQKKMKSEFLENDKAISAYESVFRNLYSFLKKDSLCIMHLGVVKKMNMGENVIPYAETHGFQEVALIYEDTSKLESHGIVDRGATQKHQILILKKK